MGARRKVWWRNWCESLRVVPMQIWLKEKKMETFCYENLEVKVLSRQNWDRKEAGESYCKTGGLVLSYACRYSGVWSCGASEAFLLLLTARNVENTQGATLVKILFYLFWLCFCFFFNCFKRRKGGGSGDIRNPSHSCLCVLIRTAGFSCLLITQTFQGWTLCVVGSYALRRISQTADFAGWH